MWWLSLIHIYAVMTVQSIDCWYQRAAGKAPDTPIEEFYAKNFDDAYMANRFQSMTMEAAEDVYKRQRYNRPRLVRLEEKRRARRAAARKEALS